MTAWRTAEISVVRELVPISMCAASCDGHTRTMKPFSLAQNAAQNENKKKKKDTTTSVRLN